MESKRTGNRELSFASNVDRKQAIALISYHVTCVLPESKNEMIQLLAEDVRRQVVKEIKDAKMFSVSADATPDLSRNDQLSVVCR
ncbi:Hypothetical predicted protein [Paramuricea clavata]|uniref:Uncharacterized protein n=1 Tax=Paramuricea clavata TaxID=317549 RepID=A0A7D9DZA0_PARCT|nr:Hypothetical predicted protein [Paramuricea clavata]